MSTTHSNLPSSSLPSLAASIGVRNARYISLFCSFLVALSAGSNYGFSSYSPQLQERLHLSSTQINIVGVMGNMGVYLSGPFWGNLVDKRGPHIPLLLGAALVLVGYGGLAFSYKGVLWQSTSLAFLAVLSLCTGLGNCAAFTAAMNAQAKSWTEDYRGLCTAMVLSGFGLSAFFYSTLSHTLFPGRTSDYLLLLALGSCFSFLVGLSFIRILSPHLEDSQHAVATSEGHAYNAVRLSEERPPRARLPSQALDVDAPDDDATYSQPRSSFTRRRTSSDIGGRAWAFAAQADEEEDERQGCSAHPYGERIDSVTRADAQRHEQQGLLRPESNDAVSVSAGGAGSSSDPASFKHDASHDHANGKTGWKLAKDADFLILFSIMTIISGTGLLVINNIGSMTRTLYEHNKKHTSADALADALLATNATPAVEGLSLETFAFDAEAYEHGDVQQLQAHQVSVISLGNALGRIIMGLLSDLTVNRTGDQRYRVYMLLPICTLALLSQGVAAWPNLIRDLKKLMMMSAVTGLMYGTLFGLCPVLTFEWFGLRHFSQNWGIASLSPVIAGNAFNLLFGKIYDSHVPPNSHAHICPDGEDCFRAVFRFTAFGAVLATVLSVVLIARKTGRIVSGDVVP